MRAKATVASVLVVGAAMAAGSFGLIAVLRSSMTEGVENTAGAQLSNVIALVRLGHLPSVLPAGQADVLTQVVGPGGKVLAASANLADNTPISTLHPGEEGAVIRAIPTLTSDDNGGTDTDGPYLLMAKTSSIAGIPGGPVTVYVAGTLQPVTEATGTVEAALAGGVPALTILVGLLVWVLAGRALRPVEAMRAEVADISVHDLHRRVPEPAASDEISRLARTMNRMLDRLESSVEAQKRFAADASHELRSPLSTIRAMLEVAAAHPREASWSDTAAGALDELRRLQSTVEDLLLLAEAEQADDAVRSEPVDLDEIVLAEGRRLRASAEVVVDLRGVSAGRVRGDAGGLGRVVRNLLDNAGRHAVGRVAVELRTRDGQVILAIDDDGPGIPAGEREQIFERFTRLDEARSASAGGTGLGLAIVREIVNAHGGSVSATTGRLGGARFIVRLPADEPSDGAG